MRIWSIHPRYLDAKGLVALWRETLLAQNVLLGKTKGYKNHAQLIRFKNQPDPIKAISSYLHYVCDEADKRFYAFNRSKAYYKRKDIIPIQVNSGQIHYEWQHLLKKLEKRNQELFYKLKILKNIEPHPLFVIIKGDIEIWEII